VALVPFRDANQLGWQQPGWFSRNIEISSSGSLAALLRFQNWGRRCDATCADGMWRFDTPGFFGRTVKLTSLPNGSPVGSFNWKFRSGLVRLDEGEVFEWKSLGFWSRERAFLTPSGFPVLTFKPTVFSLKSRGEITIHREYANIPQLPMLVMLGVHLVLTEQRRRRG
jgi:hypothetical protein